METTSSFIAKLLDPETEPDPFNEGIEAKREGALWSACPYSDPIRREQWFRGYDAEKRPSGQNQARESHRAAHGLDSAFTPETTDIINTQAAQLAAYPADWRTDSSLETGFPLTAEQIKAQTAEIAQLRDVLRIARDHINMSALEISHRKDAAMIRAALQEKLSG